MLSSTIGRNKSFINGEVLSEIINGTEELLSEHKKFGVNIISTGGETADVGDLVRTIIVDSTVVVRMKRKDVIDNKKLFKQVMLLLAYLHQEGQVMKIVIMEVWEVMD